MARICGAITLLVNPSSAPEGRPFEQMNPSHFQPLQGAERSPPFPIRRQCSNCLIFNRFVHSSAAFTEVGE